MSFQSRLIAVFAVLVTAVQLAAEPLNVSGVYPHLTMRNNEGECGTGAVVPWGGQFVGDYLVSGRKYKKPYRIKVDPA